MQSNRNHTALQSTQTNNSSQPVGPSYPQQSSRVRQTPRPQHKHSIQSKPSSALHSNNASESNSKRFAKWRSKARNTTPTAKADMEDNVEEHCFSRFSLQGHAFWPTLAFIGGCLCGVAGLALVVVGAMIDANDGKHEFHFLAMWLCGTVLTAVSVVVCRYLKLIFISDLLAKINVKDMLKINVNWLKCKFKKPIIHASSRI